MKQSLEDVIFSLNSDVKPRGRFAPSPSGRMHLGNVYAALVSYISVKSRGGEWVLRIEDIDPQRSKSRYADLIISDLQWLGMQWDEGPYFQSEREDIYMNHLAFLASQGVLYPCSCTRAELHAPNAPHASDGTLIYSGHCRPDHLLYDVPLNGATLRLRTDKAARGLQSGCVSFIDDLTGEKSFDIEKECGDFIVRRRDGAWAYQFAVTIDDALMGITEVVRGEDLLLSTAPQRYLASILDLTPPWRYIHIPLLKNESGIRLSKRDNSLSMEYLRQKFSPCQVIAMVCDACDLPFDRVLPLLSIS